MALSTFHIRGQTNAICPLGQLYIKIYSRKDIEMSCLEILYLLKLYILYVRDLNHVWYQMNQADYCLKHLKKIVKIDCPVVFTLIDGRTNTHRTLTTISV